MIKSYLYEYRIASPKKGMSPVEGSFMVYGTTKEEADIVVANMYTRIYNAVKKSNESFLKMKCSFKKSEILESEGKVTYLY